MTIADTFDNDHINLIGNAVIDFDYTAGEREYKDSPAVPDDIEVTSLTLDGKDVDFAKLTKDQQIAIETACWEKLADLEDDDV